MRYLAPAVAISVLFLGNACGVTSEPADLLPAPIPITACNGSAKLCDRPLNEVVFLTAHNAMSNDEEGWVPPNHEYPIGRQLADGVRGISLDIHPDPKNETGDPLLCHSLCALGSAPLGETLTAIRDFLQENPHEVVAILYESYVPDGDSSPVFEASGITKYAYAHPVSTAWPTLRELIEADTRVVIFSQNGGGDTPWNHPMWEYTWDTPYSYKSVDEFDCSVGRGDATKTIFQMNHFLTAPLAALELAEQANRYDVLMPRVERCLEETGKLPTFLWVDFYATGDAKRVVDELNLR
jgi:hypothetical protein